MRAQLALESKDYTVMNCSWLGGLQCLAAGLVLCPGLMGQEQNLDLHDAVRTYAAVSNTTVRLSGRAELRLTATGDPLPGCVIHLDSEDAWVLLANVPPSRVASTFLDRVRVRGASAILDANVRVVQHLQGALVIPQGPDFAPLEVFDGRYFTGPSRRLHTFVAYDQSSLGPVATGMGSFKLKRGYSATLAQAENGSGFSLCYVAQDGDLEVGRLPTALANNVGYVRVFPWRWTAKKGIAGDIESGLNLSWLYNWNISRHSPLDWEYTPIRQTRWWPGLDQDWSARGSTHLLGYNEPDRPDQANMTVAEAISAWPDVLAPGLRVGAPAVSDGGLNWLYDFIARADAAGLRVDFVPVHYYRCYGNLGDPAGTATQFYNFLQEIYDIVKRPLWVTEWNNGANWTGCGDPSVAQQEAAVQAMVDMLENTSFVERYALYNWVEDVRRVKWDDGSLTPAGVRYRDKVSTMAYRQEMADAGVGSSARYSFDGDTHDGWGNGQDAMRIGAPVFTAGKDGEAIALNGATDYLQVSPRLADSTAWSFTGWVHWSGGGSWQRIFDFGRDSSHYLFLSPRTAGGFLRFAINNGGGEQQLSGPPLVPGVWTHVAVTIAATTGKLFVNGLPVATNTSMSINPGDVGTKYNYLGKSRFSADPLFAGRFDDFRFISSALTDAQILAIYNVPPPRFRTTTFYKADAAVNQPYSASLAGDAIGTGPLTFSRMDGPSWLTVTANGSLQGTPGPTNGGIHSFLVRVTDTNGSLHTARLLITVPFLSAAIRSSADDAEQTLGGAVNLASSNLELVHDDASGVGTQIVGLRFTDVSIPHGAVVTSAAIEFTASASQSAPTSLNIYAHASDDAPSFTTGVNNIGSRARTTVNVPWQPEAWTAGDSSAAQRTPNLAGLLQEIVSRPGWASGQAIAFIITGSGRRSAHAFEQGAPPRLLVHYRMPAPLLTVRSTVKSGADDAEQAAAGTVDLASTDLELVTDIASGAGEQMVGLRFEDVAVPAGAIIANAHLQFSADEAQSTPTALTFRAEAADNPVSFAAAVHNLSSRPLTVASVAWSPAPWSSINERGAPQRTPDLAELVREIIARPGWSSGNAIAFLISGTGHRTGESADKPGGLPATLTVNFWQELPLGTYVRWAAAHPEAISPQADPDADGYNNLFEYALGLNPAAPERGFLSLAVNGPWLELTYSRAATAVDVSFQVEWADRIDAHFWSRGGVTQQIESDDGVRRLIRALVPRGAGSQRFVRLRITHQENPALGVTGL